MAAEIDKDILIDNIQYLLKERGIKLGDFEKDTGMYPGYLSRLTKEPTAKPGFDFIINAADHLKVTVDSLIRHRFTGATPTEKYIESFLNKLISDTDADKLSWDVGDSFLLSLLEVDYDGDTGHPLFTEENVYRKDESGELKLTREVVFKSKTFSTLTELNGDCYSIELKNKSTFYLMDVKCREKINDGPSTALEGWFYIPREGKSFLYSTSKDDYLAGLLYSLHSSIKENLKHPKVDTSIKKIIDSFMKDDFSDDSDDIPF